MITILVVLFILAILFLFLGVKETRKEKSNFIPVSGKYSPRGFISTGNGISKNSYNRGKPYGN